MFLHNNTMSLSSIIYFFRKDNFRILHIGLICTAILALALAYYVEYIRSILPCPLCIYQRFPYLVLMKILITTLISKKISKYSMTFISLTLLCACLLASYHSGVERGIFAPNALCSSLLYIPDHLSIQEIKAMIYSQPIITCTKAPFKIFDLSMTEWNLLLNFSLLLGVLFLWFYPKSY